MSDFKARIIAELDTSKVEQQINDLNGKKVKFDVDTGNTQKNINSIGNSIKSTAKTASSFSETLKKSLNIGAAATLAREGFQLIRTAANNAIESIKDLNGAIVDLQMATGQSYNQVSKLVSNYNEMAKSLGATTTQITEAADSWLRQGNSLSETNTLIRDSMILSKVGQLDSAAATQYLTSSMKGYKVAADDALGIIDKLTAVDLESATNAGGLAEAMSEVAVTASNAGISMDKLLGYLAATGEVTQESMSTIGTSFKTIFTRMSDIKSGKLELIDEDGTTEILSDVEQTLANVGIDLRTTVTEYNNYGDVLDNLAAKWDSLSQVQQNALTKAFAGTRQQNRFRVLMENYDNAKKYMNVAANSAGTAENKFSAYLDSIEAKVNSLQASFESLAVNTISSEMVKDIISATNAVIKFLDKANILKGSLAGIVTTGAIKGFTLMAAGISKATYTLNDFNNVLQLVKTGSIGNDEIQKLSAMTANLSKSQLKTVLSSKTLSAEQRKMILTSHGLSDAEAEAAMSSMGLASAENTATATTFSLSGAFKGLWATLKANPLILVMTAITAVVAAYSTYKQKIEEARQASLDAANTAKEEAENIRDLYLSYSKANEAYQNNTGSKEDLEKATTSLLETLGYEQSEVQKLIDKYGSLDKAIQQVTIDSLQKNYGDMLSGYETAKETVIDKGKTNIIGNSYDALNYFGDSKNSATQQARKILAENGFIEDLYGTAGGTSYLQGLNPNFEIDSFERIAESYQKYIDMREELEANIGDNTYSAEELSKSKLYQAINDKINQVREEIENAEGYIDDINKTEAQIQILNGFNKNGIPQSQNEVDAFSDSMVEAALNSNKFIGSSDDIKSAIRSVLTSISELSAYNINIDNQNIDDLTDSATSLSESLETLDDIAKGIKALDTAFGEMKNDGKVSFDTLSDIQSAFSDVDGIDDYIKKLADADISTEEFNKVLSDLTYAKIQNALTDEQIVASGEDVIRSMLESNGVTNADAVATDILTRAKANLAAQNYDITNISRDSLEKEAEQSNLTASEFAYLVYQEQIFNNTSLDVDDKLNALEKLASSARVASASLAMALAGRDAGDSFLDENGEIWLPTNSGTYIKFSDVEDSVIDKLNKPNKTIDSKYSGSSSKGSGSSGSSSSKQIAETFDWIETKISRIERAISNLKSKVEDTFSSWGKRNKALSKEINSVTKEINIQEKAASKYQKKANAVGISSSWKKKIKDGSFDIDKVKSEKLKEKIQEYQKWYEKVLECKDSIQELKSTLNDLNQEKFDNWMTRFDNSLQSKIQDNEILKSNISRRNAEASSSNTIDYSTEAAKSNISDYKSIISNNDAIIAKRQTEIKKLQKIQKSTPKNTEAWYKQQDEINNIQNEINDLKEDSIDASNEIAQSYVTMFDNIGAKFDISLSDIEHRNNLLEEQINQIELSGHMVNESFYKAQSELNNQNQATLEAQLAQQQQVLNEAVASGNIKVGSEDWKDMISAINETAEGIEGCKTKTIEFNKAIRDLHWELFDMFQEKVSDITSESDFLIDLLSRKDLFDDKGKFTDEGNAVFGLRVTNMETYTRQAKEYANEVARLDAEYANDPLNTDYLDRRQKLIELQRDCIKNTEDEKDAIVDLIQDGIDAELNALQELIDKRKDALQAQKDLYDYQKNIKNQAKEIASLEKQLSAYSGDISEETKAKIQQIKVSLEEAQENLRETEYDKYISDQEKLLDDLYDEYEEVLNSRLDDVSALIQGVIDTSNSNADKISTTIRELSGANGYSLQSIGEILGSAQNGDILTAVNNVVAAINSLTTALTNTNGTKPNIIGGEGYSGSSEATNSQNAGNSTQQPTIKQGNGQIDIGDTVEFVAKKGKRHYYEDSKGNGRKEITDKNSSSFIVTRINTGADYPYLLENKNGVKLGWVNSSQITGYASGVKNLSNDEIAWTQENAREFIIRKADGAVLTPLMKGDSVLNSVASENLWKLANNPYEYLNDNFAKMVSRINTNSIANRSFDGNIENNITITLPNVQNYDDFKRELQRDKSFEKMIQSMTVDRITGGSVFGKYKY